MDFTLSDTDEALRDLTARILGDQTDQARHKAAESDARAGGTGVDAALWAALAGAGLLAAFLEPAPAAPNRGPSGSDASADVTGSVDGGSSGNWGRSGSDVSTDVTGSVDGGSSGNWGRSGSDASADVTGSVDEGRPGVVAAALMCREAGATVAPVPLASTLAALLVARDAVDPRVVGACRAVTAGDGWAAVAAAELGGVAPRRASVRAAAGADGVRLTGTVGLVADLPGAAWIAVDALAVGGVAGAYWIDAAAPGVTTEHVVTTAARAAGRLTLDGALAVRLGDAPAGLVGQTLVAATQAGVCSSAIRDAAEYLGTRHQFGRPLASFQAPVHRLVDAYIDTDAIWLTALLAAWRLDAGLDAAAAVDVARWWAADAGNRAVHTVQHLHGGIGSDVDYPVHRYFLWAKTVGDMSGGGAAHLAHLGELIATGADL